MQDLLKQELQVDETLVWSGLPRQGLIFKANDIFMIPFSLMWGGFAFFWELSVFSSNAPIFFRLWGIPFVLVGIYIIAGRFFFDAKIRAGTLYGLTNKRAIIISGLLSKKTTSINLKNISEVQVTKKSDGSGTIILGASNPLQFFQNASWPGATKGTPSFEGIQNVDLVKKYIHQYQT
jgi:hypothetical protein